MLVLALIFFRGIVIEAAKKSRPKGDITKDQIQSPTPGSNNVREYTVEHTPELGEEPSQKKIRRQGNSKRKSTAMSHLNEFEIEAARSKNALSKRAYRMQIIYANYSLTQSICMLTCSSSTFSGEGMTPDEIEAARVKNTKTSIWQMPQETACYHRSSLCRWRCRQRTRRHSSFRTSLSGVPALPLTS